MVITICAKIHHSRINNKKVMMEKGEGGGGGGCGGSEGRGGAIRQRFTVGVALKFSSRIFI